MKTPRRIRTVVVSVPVDNDWMTQDRLDAGRPRIKPSDMVPWSDPTIAALVHKLQDEVRDTSTRSNAELAERVMAEAEMPWNEPFEYETEDTGFSIDTDALLGL